MKVTGRMIINTGLVLKPGQMAQNMQVSTTWVLKKVKVFIRFLMEQTTKGTSYKTRFVDMEFNFGQMEQNTMGSGRQTACTDMDYMYM